MQKPRFRQPSQSEEEILQKVEVRLLDPDNAAERELYGELMKKHHYLRGDKLVGEQLRYVAHVEGSIVALLSWSAAAKHLRWRDQWIGWSAEQLRRRRSLVANNARFLILPDVGCPNLASRVLGLCCKRLSQDWQQAYGHEILVVESFVDSQLFRGTSYKAQGWEQLGETRGFERKSQDYFVAHDRPKQLWVRELRTGAREILRGEHLPPELQAEEDKVVPLPQVAISELHPLWELCRQVPEWRKRKGRDYPLPCILAIIVMAAFCGVVRGQRDLAAFASKLTQRQLRALRSYRRRDGVYTYPKETTFQRVLAEVDAGVFERVLQEWTARMLGPAKEGELRLVAVDGKAQCGSNPDVKKEKKAQVVSAQSLPDGLVLASVLVEEKTNEIPAGRDLLDKLGDMGGTLCMLDALHANQTTLRKIVQDNGADYLIPVKDNHEGLRQRVEALFAGPPGPQNTGNTQSAAAPSGSGFSPLATNGHGHGRKPVRYSRRRRKKQPLAP